MAQIHEKLKELPEDVGEDFSKAESFHRMHAAFERDITALGKQVRRRGEQMFYSEGDTASSGRQSDFDDSYLRAAGSDATSQQPWEKSFPQKEPIKGQQGVVGCVIGLHIPFCQVSC